MTTTKPYTEDQIKFAEAIQIAMEMQAIVGIVSVQPGAPKMPFSAQDSAQRSSGVIDVMTTYATGIVPELRPGFFILCGTPEHAIMKMMRTTNTNDEILAKYGTLSPIKALEIRAEREGKGKAAS